MKKVKPILQFAHNECGACCLTMLLEYYNVIVSPDELNEFLKVSRDGSKLRDMKKCLEQFGFKVKVYECNINGLAQLKMPLILTWEHNHYVMLERVSSNYVVIVDPAIGRYKCSFDILQKKFTGYALLGSNGKERIFYCSHKEISFYKLVVGNIKKIVLPLLFSLLIYFLTISISILVQQAMDNIQLLNEVAYQFVIYLTLFVYFHFSLFINLKKKNISNDIYHQIYFSAIDKIFSIPNEYYITHSEGDILFRLNCIGIVNQMVVDEFLGIVVEIGICICILLFLLSLSHQVFFICIITLLISIIIIILLIKIINSINKMVLQQSNALNELVVDNVVNLETIKFSGEEDRIITEWKEYFGRYLITKDKFDKWSAIFQTTIYCLPIFIPIFILLITAKNQDSFSLTLGEIIGFFTIISILLSSLISSILSINELLINKKYYMRLEGFLNITNSRVGHRKPQFKDAVHLTIDNLGYQYNENNKVFYNVSMEVYEGSTIAIIGKSGAGKSTLIRLICGIYQVQLGDIMFNGMSIREIDMKYMRQHIGVVSQEIILLNKTIYNNITFGNNVYTQQDVNEVCKLVGIYEDINNMPMGLNTIVGSKGNNLSGGQKQKIMIARALLKKPKLLILDEATSNLDIESEVKIMDSLQQLKCTKIIITHKKTIAQYADKVYELKEGILKEMKI